MQPNNNVPTIPLYALTTTGDISGVKDYVFSHYLGNGDEQDYSDFVQIFLVTVADEVMSALEKVRAVLMQAPCGAGKTIIAAELIRRYLDQNKRILFLAHRRELVFQCGDKLRNLEIHFAYLMAGEERSLIPDVTIASIQTLVARIARKRIEPPLADLIIADECHHIVSKTQLKIIDSYPHAKIIGLTATPIRGDGRGLGRAA